MKYYKLLAMFLLPTLSFAVTQTCNQTGQTCLNNSPSKYYNGQEFTLAELGISCWEYDIQKDCPLVDTCQPLVNSGCIIDLSRNQCTELDSSGKCVSWNKTARCSTDNPTSNTMISCGNEICKPDANGNLTNCYQLDPGADTDFGAAMAALEVANEMGTMKNCYDRRTGQKCQLSDPNDPSKGVDANCECFFFQGKFTTYKDSYNVWVGAGGGAAKVGVTFTSCDRVANEYSSLRSPNRLQATSNALPQRNIDKWSDKGQLNLSLTGNKDTTGIHAGNQYVYSFASPSQGFNQSGTGLNGQTDNWAATNQKNSNYQLSASVSNKVIDKDDPNASSNQIHWNAGGNKTGQGSTATQSNGTMKVIQDASKMLADVLDIGSAFSQSCNAEDQSKMINVGKNHCLFDYSGVPGPENNQWILYTYGDKLKKSKGEDCSYQVTFWGAALACTTGSEGWATCKNKFECKGGANTCTDEWCYGQTKGGRGGDDAYTDATGGNQIIWKGNVNCCYPSTISKIINKAAFEQQIGGRQKLSQIRDSVAIFRSTEVCSVDELANGTCNSGNTGLDTAKTFQAMCERGITINEMQLIDFSKIDFSEFYAEANRGVNTNAYNQSSATNSNQTNRVQNSINTQKRQSLQLEGKNYFDY